MNRRSVMLAYVLWFFFGILGVHRFYLGHVALGLFAGFLFGALAGIGLMAVRGRDRKSAIPFGPFLAAGALLALVAGDPLIDLYLGS